MKETLLSLITSLFAYTNVNVDDMIVTYNHVSNVKFEKLHRNPYIQPVYNPKVLDLVFMKNTIGVLVDKEVVFFLNKDNEADCDLLVNLDVKMFGRVSNKRNPKNLVMYHFKPFKKYKKIKPMINKVSLEQGIPVEILESMIYAESKFNKHAKSHTNVRGLTMITRATAKRYNIDTTTTLGQIRGMATIFNSIMNKLPKSDYTLQERYKLASFCYNRGTKHLLQVRNFLKNKNVEITYENTMHKLKRYKYCREGINYISRINRHTVMFT